MCEKLHAIIGINGATVELANKSKKKNIFRATTKLRYLIDFQYITHRIYAYLESRE